MIEEYYDAGGDHAQTDLGLEKAAFVMPALRAAGSAMKAMGPKLGPKLTQAVGTAGSALNAGKGMAAKAYQAGTAPIRQGYGAVANKLAPVGKAMEEGAAAGVGKVLGKPGADLTKRVVKGTPGKALREATSFGVLGAGIEGGLGAATAEEGQKGKAFLEGAGHGALSGAAMGGLMGGFGGAMKNVRRGSLQQAAMRQGMKGGKSLQAANQQLNRGFFKSIGDTAMGGGNLGRKGSAQNVAGGMAQVGAEWMAPLAVLPAALGGGHAMTMGFDPEMFSGAPQGHQPPQQQPQAYAPQNYPAKLGSIISDPLETTMGNEKLKEPARLLTTLSSGAATGIPTGIAFDSMAKKPWYPKGAKGSLLSRTGQTLGTAAGLLGGHYLGNEVFPRQETDSEVEQKLEQIDFDKLMRYYKKREADHV